jgi:hypothetical protein
MMKPGDRERIMVADRSALGVLGFIFGGVTAVVMLVQAS